MLEIDSIQTELVEKVIFKNCEGIWIQVIVRNGELDSIKTELSQRRTDMKAASPMAAIEIARKEVEAVDIAIAASAYKAPGEGSAS